MASIGLRILPVPSHKHIEYQISPTDSPSDRTFLSIFTASTVAAFYITKDLIIDSRTHSERNYLVIITYILSPGK